MPFAPPRCSALLHPLSLLAGGGWKEEAYVLVSLFMLYCALGIHVDESGSPEERQSGDGTSFPESPDLNHVGITAAFQRPSNSTTGIMSASYVICALWSHII